LLELFLFFGAKIILTLLDDFLVKLQYPIFVELIILLGVRGLLLQTINIIIEVEVDLSQHEIVKLLLQTMDLFLLGLELIEVGVLFLENADVKVEEVLVFLVVSQLS
jgi:hypothetical protein